MFCRKIENHQRRKKPRLQPVTFELLSTDAQLSENHNPCMMQVKTIYFS